MGWDNGDNQLPLFQLRRSGGVELCLLRGRVNHVPLGLYQFWTEILLDRCFQRVDTILAFICFLRVLIGFGISFGTISFIKKAGYEGAMNIYAGTVTALAIVGDPVYVFGKRVRIRTSKHMQDV